MAMEQTRSINAGGTQEDCMDVKGKDLPLGLPNLLQSLLPVEKARTSADCKPHAELHTRKSFSRVLWLYWSDPKARREAIPGALAVAGLTLVNTVVMLGTAIINGFVLKAFVEKDRRSFYKGLLAHLLNTVVGVPSYVTAIYCKGLLAARWREWLTSRILSKYLHQRKYYEIQSAGQLDNPDQRIHDDIRNCTATALETSQLFLSAAFNFTAFSAILISMYPPMFWAAVGYAAIGTKVSLCLGKPLVELNFKQEEHEADFRFALIRLRENAESIAFYKGEGGEKELLMRRLCSVMRNTMQTQVVGRTLGVFTEAYRNVILFLPWLVAVPHYMAGGIELQFVTACAETFNRIALDASLVVYHIEKLADFRMTVQRLDEFLDVLEAEPGPTKISRGDSKPPSLLSVQDLSVQTPDQRKLFSNLDFELDSGESLLITGPSGCGKTSLMRVLAGLWDLGRGTVCCEAEGRAEALSKAPLLFMPQRPYMVLGSLREQMLYPTWSSSSLQVCSTPVPSQGGLEGMLEAVRLAHLLQRKGGLDAVADWAAVLSLGEQQRLALTRVLLAKPALALLDECTSALDEESEAQIYALLRSSGTAYVSVGHRSTLRGHHDQLLKFSLTCTSEDGCTWALGSCQSA